MNELEQFLTDFIWCMAYIMCFMAVLMVGVLIVI